MTNTLDDAINKFVTGKCGVISLPEGYRIDQVVSLLEENNQDTELVALQPLEEVGDYIVDPPYIWGVTTECKHPGGVMNYFFAPMLNDDAVQSIWTNGVENYPFIESKLALNKEDWLDPTNEIFSEIVNKTDALVDGSIRYTPAYRYNETWMEYETSLYDERVKVINNVVIEGGDIQEAISSYIFFVQEVAEQIINELNNDY